jgi:hypothetical protein
MVLTPVPLPGPADSDFFVTGGTLPLEASSYIERAADRALLAHLLSGRFCYVLNARQMGKSSLCVRTIGKLEAEGVRCAFVDLTRIGGHNVTPEQWYAGIAMEIGRALGLRREVLAYWKAEERLGPMQRLFGALREVVLSEIAGPVAVFFDEIDATRSLSFNADEFFAAIRECYNRRVQDSEYERLTFCLLGVAVPSDLIQSPEATPFNIGERIYLSDFTLGEATSLAEGLPDAARETLERIHYWTNGHPFLTQSLCALVVAQQIYSRDGVDELVEREFLNSSARDTNVNLADVANRALRSGEHEANPDQFRAALLTAYQEAWSGRPPVDDEGNRVIALLKLSGLMRVDDGRLFVRNRIYHRVFGRAWIRENMPDQEIRRQRRSFRLGVLRTASLAAVVVACIAALALRNGHLASRADYEAYVSNMNLMGPAYNSGDRGYMRSLLDRTADNPNRDIEWGMWNNRLHDGLREFHPFEGDYDCGFSPDGKSAFVHVFGPNLNRAYVLDYPTLKVRKTFPDLKRGYKWCFPGGRLTGIRAADSVHFEALDAESGKLSSFSESEEIFGRLFLSSDASSILVLRVTSTSDALNGAAVWSAATGAKLGEYSMQGSEGWEIGRETAAVSDDGTRAAVEMVRKQGDVRKLAIIDVGNRKVVDAIPLPAPCTAVAFNHDGSRLAYAFGAESGRVVVRDLADGRDLRSWPVRLPGALQMRGTGRYLLCEQPHSFEVFDVQTGAMVVRRTGELATLAPDEQTVMAGGDAVYQYRVMRDPHQASFPGALMVSALPNGTLSVLLPGSIRTLNGTTLQECRPAASVDTSSVNFSSNGAFRLVVGDARQSLVDLSDNRPLFDVEYSFAPLSSQDWDCLHPDGPVVILDKSQNRIALFSDQTTSPVWEKAYPFLSAVCISPDSRFVAVGDSLGALVLLDARDGHEVTRRQVSELDADPVQFSPDGSEVLAHSRTRFLIWRPFASDPLPTWLEGSTGERFAAFTPDSRRVVGTIADGSAVIWDSETGRKVTSFMRGRALISVAVSKTGGAIYCLQDDGTLFHLATAK